ncbi:hypothetical protein KEJ21_01665 [Candidatus Bathyarchaeota archaeon]|nr:hypothetical protein [Candidatus Bathyarchaeota archaeon]MBS7630890.1 hypothetical protein [Candidatus Bathyarchaeota archaeon]
MSYAVLVYGSIGSGKTLTCLSLVERLRFKGITFGGLISIRSYQEGKLKGYDGLDVVSGEMKPLARLGNGAPNTGWFSFGGLKYVFSIQGFNWANDVLIRTVESEYPPSIVFIDEYGRLEKAGLGIYPGVLKILERLGSEGILIFTCRDDIVDVLEGLLKGKVDVIYKFKPEEFDSLWNAIQKLLSHSLNS